MDYTKDRIAIIHHNDGDGICSAAIFALTLKKLDNFPVLIHAPEHVDIEEDTRQMIKESGAEQVIFLDIPIERLSNVNLPTLIIDHHPHTRKLDLDGEIHHITSNCASYLTYEFCKKITEIDDLAWIAAIGCLSDKDEQGLERIFPTVEKESGLDRTIIQKMMGFISSAKVLGSDGISCGVNALIEASTMGIETSVLGSTPNSQKLRELRQISRSERDYWLLFHKDFAKIKDRLIYYRIKSKLPIQSYLAGTLSNFYPKHVCFVTNDNFVDKFRTIECRTKLEGISLGQMLRHIAEELGGSGGGLDYAAGAKIPPEKENDFLERCESVINDV
jgi:single-stranded DNA-specific DHH superfamily exonuclease